MKKSGSAKRKDLDRANLLKIVFSWSLEDVLNKNLYKHQVRTIPHTFSSITDYMNSFIPSLIEETHDELCSSLRDLDQAPLCEILSIKPDMPDNFIPTERLFYQISVKRTNDDVKDVRKYKPAVGDVIAFTNFKPKTVYDLNRLKKFYHIAYVHGLNGSTNKVLIFSSKSFDKVFQCGLRRNNAPKLYALYLLNLTSNGRIWEALNSQLMGASMSVIKEVLQADSKNGEKCQLCSSGENHIVAYSSAQDIIQSQNLNESQKDAVLSCVATSQCNHNNTVKLIWGPPGTGKTKTVASLLFSLLKLKTRTLTCAPTNTAVMQVAARLHNLVKGSLEHDTYGLGDIVVRK